MNANLPSVSSIVCEALKLTPTGQPFSKLDLQNAEKSGQTHCALCGTPHAPDTPVVPLSLPQTFTNNGQLILGQGLVCGYCDVTIKQDVMRTLQRAVITRHGVYPIGTDDARAWFLLTPPEPPFVAVVQTRSPTSTFHLHWHTPVTLSKQLMRVRVDDRVLTINANSLTQALADCRLIADEIQSRRPAAKRRDSLNHPFRFLDRSLSDPAHGVLHQDAINLRYITDGSVTPAVLEALKRLDALGSGELWALATLAKATPPTPTAPTPITNFSQFKADKEAALAQAA